MVTSETLKAAEDRTTQAYKDVCADIGVKTNAGIEVRSGKNGFPFGTPDEFRTVHRLALEAGYDVDHGTVNTVLGLDFRKHSPRCKGCYACSAAIWARNKDEETRIMDNGVVGASA